MGIASVTTKLTEINLVIGAYIGKATDTNKEYTKNSFVIGSRYAHVAHFKPVTFDDKFILPLIDRRRKLLVLPY